MDDAAPAGVVAAELADRRSKPAVIADHVPLVLEPTRRVSGRIDLTGIPPGGVEVVCVPVQAVTSRFVLLAPIGSDGTFSLDGASVGAVRIGVSIQTGWAGERLELDTLPASPTSITGLQLTFATSNREMDIVVRSAVDTPLDGVLVVLMSGKHPIDRLKNVRDLDRMPGIGVQYRYAVPAVDEDAPKGASGKLRTGDLVAHFAHAHTGDLTACAYTIGGDLADAGPWRRLRDHAEQLALRCEPVAPDANLVVVTVPPQQRLD
jgi:hypothetical protein